MNTSIMSRFYLLFATVVLVGSGLRAETTVDRAMLGMFQPLTEVAENPDNPLTPEKIDLGRMLYYDKRLSKNNSVSCNTCHVLDSYGDDGLPVSKGIHEQLGGRSAP